jgi:hypothetical protein
MKKIKINFKAEKKDKKKSDNCPICGQYMDLCVISHKNKPFVDNRLYPKICFTCYCVPKVSDQKYDENGYIKEEIDLEYSHKNLYKPEDLLLKGSAENIHQATKSYKAVKNLQIEKQIKNKTKPKLECYINH